MNPFELLILGPFDLIGTALAGLVGVVPGLLVGLLARIPLAPLAISAEIAVDPLAVSAGVSLPAMFTPALGALVGFAGPFASAGMLGDAAGNVLSSIFRAAYGTMAGAA
jgi:hypothetical protein